MPYNSIITRGTDPTYLQTANNANPLIPVEVSEKIVKGAVAKSAVMRLAKQVRMSRHMKTMPVLNSLPTTYWVSDPMGLKQTTRVDWRGVNIVAEELAALVIVPDVVRKDMDANIWGEIRPLLEEAIGKAVDEAILFGINKPASWPDDIKTAAIAAGNTVTEGAGVDIAADANSLLAAVENDGFGPNAYAMQMSMKSRFRGLRSTQNEPIFQPGYGGIDKATFGDNASADEGFVWGVRALASRNGAFEAEDAATANSVSMIAGDWEQLYFAVREDMNIDFSNSAVIVDDQGVVQYNAWQQDATVLRVIFRCGFAVPNPTTRLQETTANRYPFAVLRESA